jgi:hypothetical protein
MRDAPLSDQDQKTDYPHCDYFCGFPPFLRAFTGIIPQTKPRHLLSTYFSNLRTRVIPVFSATQLELMTAPFN